MAAVSPASELRFKLHVKQSLAFQSEATEILYGGSAGSAKSHLMRVAAIAWCGEISGLQVYFFRRIREDLIKNHMEGPTGFRSMLAPLIGRGVEIIEDEIRFSNGSKIFMCHCKDEKDRFKYQGAEIHVLVIDELTHFTEVIYRYLRSRVRMPMSMNIPDRYRPRFPRVLAGTNPGGIGHQWVKSTFIDAKPAYEKWKTPANEGGFIRQFIPARLSDNPSIDQESYTNNLSGLGNPELVKAMLEGNWDVVAGAAFDITRERHMLRAFTPPMHWTRFMSMDWGYVRPFSVGWYCVAEGETLLTAKGEWGDKLIPNGAVVRYREWYGSTGKPNEGLRMDSPEVAKRIMEIEKAADEKINYRIADTQIWAKIDGASIFERMLEATDNKFIPSKSEKDRQASYSEMCTRLRGEQIEKGVFMPMFYATENCHDFWRTVPTLILDDINPERGPGETQENHVWDETAYGLMSRPYVTTQAQIIERAFYSNRRLAKIDNSDPYRVKPKVMVGLRTKKSGKKR